MLLKIYKKCEKWPEAMPKFMIVAYNSGKEESSDSDVNIPVMPMTSIKVWMFTRHCQWVTSMTVKMIKIMPTKGSGK